MGSIVGALFATGMGHEEIAGVVRDIDWNELFDDDTPRQDQPIRRKTDDRLGLYGPALGIGEDDSLLPTGLLAGQKILNEFENRTSARVQVAHFDDLPIPYRAVATDLVNGEIVVLDQGALSVAMRASMSVPGVFDPIPVGDQVLVDGGLVRNLPVDIVRDMGANVVVAVNVGSPLRPAKDINNVLSVMDQMIGLAIDANTRAQMASLGADDVLVQPRLGRDIGSAAFDRFETAWPLGYEATMALREQLAPLALDEGAYQRWRRSLEACVTPPDQIHFVRLDNQTRFADEVIEALITLEPGDTLDTAQLDRDLRQIHALSFIEFARYQVVREGDATGVLIEVLEDARGTDLLQTGLTITGGERGANINLQGAYLKTDIGDRGSEARVLLQLGNDLTLAGDWWQYLDDRRRWIFNPQASIVSRDLVFFDEQGRARTESKIEQATASVRLGYEFARYGAVFAGARRYLGTVDETIGPGTPDFDFDGGEWFVSGIYDRLDNLFLPTRGQLAYLDYIRSDSALGADEDFEQLRFYGLASQTFGRHSFLLTGRFDTTLDDDAPIYALFTAGGFLNMSGFEPAELVGQHAGFVGAGYRYQVAQSGLLPGYVGGTVEYGNAVDRRSDVFGEGILNGSLYLAYDTPLGPFYLGYGWNELRSGVLFLRLGAAIGSENVAQR
jgi:NTE family protein